MSNLEQRKQEHKEAYDKMLTVKWKTEECGTANCWCLMITPVEEIVYSEIEEAYIAGSGCIPKEIARYIVELHNKNIENGK